MLSSRKVGVLAAAAGIALSSAALADVSNAVFTIHATDGNLTGSYSVNSDDLIPLGNGSFEWQLPDAVTIWDDQSGTVALGELAGGSIFIDEDPVVTLNFEVFAGAVNSTFTLDSALVSFANINNAIGQASAGVTVTDQLGDGATLGVGSPGSMYEARYNGSFPGGTLFAGLLNSDVVAGANQTVSASDDTTVQVIPGGIADISSRFVFSLTPFDSASGTSVFTVVIPTPATAALLGLGGLMATRRRR